MIAVLALFYASFYFLVFGKGWVEKNARNFSIFVAVGVVLVGAISFAWLTVAPQTKDGRVFQYVIPIVPNVAGQVIEVPAEPLVQMDKGDVLYRIDPVPFRVEVDRIEASIDQTKAAQHLAQLQVDRNRSLVSQSVAAQSELDRWSAELDGATAAIRSLQAQLENAQWMLEQTTVRAPHDGYIVNLQVRPGVVVGSSAGTPTISYISDESKEILASFSQSSFRAIGVGDKAEMVFALYPGEVFSGNVTHVVRASGTAQLIASGNIPVMTGAPEAGRYSVRISLDDADTLDRLPQGASCSVAVYTSSGKAFHIISLVTMRMNALMAYLTSPM